MNTEKLNEIAEAIFEAWAINPQTQIVVPANPNDYTPEFKVCEPDYKNTDESKMVFARCYDPDEWNVDVPREFDEIEKDVFIDCCTMFLRDFYEKN